MNGPTIQQLPFRWARLCLEIERFITRDLRTDIRGTTLVIGYSTGLDSTALLHILHLLAPRLTLRLVAANLNHMLRSEAFHEQEIAQTACAGLHIPFFGESADVRAYAREHGTGIEESARMLRYAFLERIRVRTGAQYIVTAHHANDLAEDVLMRLIRGAGWPGLSGMPGVDHGRSILRPLLATPKDTLQHFLEHLNLTWEEDQSNADRGFLRNRVRKDILPLFFRENPGFLASVKQLWQMGRTDQMYWENTVKTCLPTEETTLLPASLRTLDQALRWRIIKHTLETMGPGQPLAASIFKLDELWQKKATGKTIQFPGDKTGTITREGIRFGKKINQKKPEQP